MKRRYLREKALQVLYAFEMNGDNLEFLIKNILQEISFENDLNFSRTLIEKSIIHSKEFDSVIENKASNWELNRIAVIDRILIRMCMSELMYFPEIPPKVSINEVIEIAKSYSTANSGKFINGILDKILADLKLSGQLNKANRGLIDNSLPK